LILVFLVAISRVYLGRHFVVDTVGGFFLGAVIVLLLGLVARSNRLQQVGESGLTHLPISWRLLLIGYLFVLPVVLLGFHSMIDAEDAGRLLGMNVSMLMLLGMKHLPNDSGTTGSRICRVMLGIILMTLTQWLFARVTEMIPDPSIALVRFAQGFLSYLALVWGAVEVGLKLGLFIKKS
jgi:hypothetical protein